MTSRPRPTRRGTALRPAVATAEIVVLGLVAHAGAGGTLPPLDVVLALAGVVGALSTALRLRLLALPVAASLTVAVQVGLHTAGSAATDPHAHHASVTPDDQHMLLAHAVSALVTVLALVWQEQAVHAVVRALVPLLPAAVVPDQPSPRPVPSRTSAHALRQLVRAAPRRGPPTLRAPVMS